MNKALTITIATAAIFAAGVTSYAQTAGPAGTQGTLQTTPAKHKANLNWKVESAALDQILPTLSLTPQQQSQIDDLKKKTIVNLEQIRKDTKGDKVARQSKMQELAESFHKDFSSILTPAQEKQYREEHKAFMKKWREDHKKTTTTTTTPPTTPSAAPSKAGG